LNVDNIVTWLSQRVLIEKNDYTLSEAIQLIAELEQLWPGKLPLHDGHFIQPVDFSATIAALN
jgi:DNA mismatch repair protein MutL